MSERVCPDCDTVQPTGPLVPRCCRVCHSLAEPVPARMGAGAEGEEPAVSGVLTAQDAAALIAKRIG